MIKKKICISLWITIYKSTSLYPSKHLIYLIIDLAIWIMNEWMINGCKWAASFCHVKYTDQRNSSYKSPIYLILRKYMRVFNRFLTVDFWKRKEHHALCPTSFVPIWQSHTFMTLLITILCQNHPLYSIFSSVQFSWSVMSDSLWLHGQQHARLRCQSSTRRTHSNSCPSR